MVKRILAALVLAALPAVAAVETTTVTQSVYLPEGLKATGGKITCQISDPGTVDDAGVSQRVGGRMEADIAANGTVNFALIPNDAITPAGTYYVCTIKSTGPKRSSWVELWSVTTAPDPVDIGDITRLEVAPGIVVGSYMEYIDTEPTGTCGTTDVPTYAEDTNKICECVASTWSCAAAGGGTSTATLQFHRTTSVGLASTARVIVQGETNVQSGFAAVRAGSITGCSILAQIDGTDAGETVAGTCCAEGSACMTTGTISLTSTGWYTSAATQAAGIDTFAAGAQLYTYVGPQSNPPGTGNLDGVYIVMEVTYD